MKYVLLLLLLFVSCSPVKYVTKEVPVEIIKEIPLENSNNVYKSNNTQDTIKITEFIDRYVKGDTVYINKEIITDKSSVSKDTILITDTIHIIQKIEIPVKVTEPVYVEVNVLLWYQKILMYLGALFLGIIFFKFIIK